MDVFDLRKKVIGEYADYVGGFVTIRDPRLRAHVHAEMEPGVLWPQPLLQLNPAFEPGESLAALVEAGALHRGCLEIFRDKPSQNEDRGPLRNHQHQVEGIRAARRGRSYVLATGTGSGKSLSYILPIVDHVLRSRPPVAPEEVLQQLAVPPGRTIHQRCVVTGSRRFRGPPWPRWEHSDDRGSTLAIPRRPLLLKLLDRDRLCP